ncbi:uncharacterized protein A1O9_00940 [Exophiala aquamarina CBS 119918]|uniref:Vacuolar protein sorting-associated protein 51 homolog n=1 Tax=Exophiala aquamarina CBS 119918 TaxID=1182545 RepID=A0A072Q4X4_9EURO|nr:uncharacterized protein A1O9_00940 [Exophiala aquamarina CBS 119918]KEF62965.1 hypothetical protein A1O9_00940 [Exophiala aquamarina CBS 119918]
MATITSPRSESPAANAVARITSPQIPPSPSISGTPASSVRPSIEIPVRANASSPSLQQQQQNATLTPGSTGTQTQQRRNRAALRDYYNLKAKAQAPSGASGGGTHSMSRTASIASNASGSTVTSSVLAHQNTADASSLGLPAQLDDPTFDAEAHVAELLKTAGLRDILRTESVLVSEIRTLDGERKALVYDNYSKLIKAVGTIAEMQKGMHKRGGGADYAQHQARFGAAALGRSGGPSPGLEGVERLGEKLDGLVSVVKELAPAAPAEADGEPKDGTHGRLPRTNRELAAQKETVKWALDAPSRLQDLVARQEHDEARREYDAVLEALAHWKGVRGVDELRENCASVMVDVRRQWRRSSDSDDDDEEGEHDSDEEGDADDSD